MLYMGEQALGGGQQVPGAGTEAYASLMNITLTTVQSHKIMCCYNDCS